MVDALGKHALGCDLMKKPLLAIAICGATLTLSLAARAASAYDGAWSLEFVTQSGPCDPTYGFPVIIHNGIVTQPNLVRFRGRVSRSGSVQASGSVHEKYAYGRGRLTGSSGRGTWSGRSGSARCAGYWTAQRN